MTNLLVLVWDLFSREYKPESDRDREVLFGNIMRAHVWSPRRELQVPRATILVRRGSPTAHDAENLLKQIEIPLVRRSVCTRGDMCNIAIQWRRL